jgi:tetratricopeptide (TPR) repeat protein
VALIAAYGVRTVVRNEDWKSPQRLWRSTTEVSSLSPRAHNNMGDAYAQEENFAGAIREFKESIRLKPDYADAYHNLANIYQHIGDSKNAVTNYETAISLNPMLFESYYNLAVAYINLNEPDKAIALARQGLENWPDNTDLALALTIALKKKSENK